MAVATTSPALSAFFSTAFAGFLNVVFYPFAALLVLGVGFVPAWLDVWRAQWDAEPPMVDDSDAYWRDGNDDHCIDEIGPCLDPFDPRSVALWVGSPTNQHSPSDLPNQQY
jgi:hypothetical protein